MNKANNKFFNNTMIILEKFIVVFIGFLTVAFLYFYNINVIELNNTSELFSNVTSFVSIMLGILITMATLFLGYANKQIVKKIKMKNAHKLMFRYFLLPISTGMILAVGTITFATTISQKIIPIEAGRMITSIYGGISAIFLMSSIRVFLLMLSILKEVFNEDIVESKENIVDKSKDSIKLYDEDVF